MKKKNTTLTDEQAAAISSVICSVTGLPPDRVAGFAVIAAVYEDDGKPGARLIGSTPSLRTIAKMIDITRANIAGELDRLSELS